MEKKKCTRKFKKILHKNWEAYVRSLPEWMITETLLVSDKYWRKMKLEWDSNKQIWIGHCKKYSWNLCFNDNGLVIGVNWN